MKASVHLAPTRKPRKHAVGMSQQEIAEKFGVSRTAVYQVEQRALRKIRIAITKIAADAGMSVSQWLFGDEVDV